MEGKRFQSRILCALLSHHGTPRGIQTPHIPRMDRQEKGGGFHIKRTDRWRKVFVHLSHCVKNFRTGSSMAPQVSSPSFPFVASQQGGKAPCLQPWGPSGRRWLVGHCQQDTGLGGNFQALRGHMNCLKTKPVPGWELAGLLGEAAPRSGRHLPDL